MLEKKCPKCNQTKPIGEFGKHKLHKYGLSSYCKDCEKRDMHERYIKRKNRIPIVPETKVCRICQFEKPISEFGVATANKDGHLTICKSCEHLRDAEYMKTHQYPQLDLEFKTCTRCHERKPIAEFGRDKYKTDGHIRYCKSCQKLFRRETKLRHPMRMVIQNKMRRYNMSQEEYEELLSKQNGVCAICGEPETRKVRSEDVSALAVDHSHVTGQNRGLLCNHCNNGLGSFRDSPDLLIRAAEYLRKYSIEKEQK